MTMTTNEILENNKLIAEFMGCTLVGNNTVKYPMNFPIKLSRTKGGLHLPIKWLEFYSSWSWLMPVVEKICESNFVEEWVEYEYFEDWYVTFNEFSFLDSNLASLYENVIGFIKWYNKNSNNAN